MSRNKDRLGNQTPQVSSAPPQATHNAGEDSGTAFSFVVPTEFVELPSGGRFYAESHPLHNVDVVEIKHMTAKEEDLLTSRSLLKKGVALERLLRSIIINKKIDAQSLLVGDRNAIMIAARISGYGADYETGIKCPSCGASSSSHFNLNSFPVVPGEVNAELGAKELGNGLFSVVLPKTRVEVTFRLLNGYHEKTLTQQLTNARKRKKEENAITRQLSLLTVAVNGDESPEAIQYFINNVPSLDALHLRTVVKLATPNIDMKEHFECSECGHEQEMEVPLTSDFFWPQR